MPASKSFRYCAIPFDAGNVVAVGAALSFEERTRALPAGSGDGQSHNLASILSRLRSDAYTLISCIPRSHSPL